MHAVGVLALKGVYMDGLKEMEKILYVELEKYTEPFPRTEYFSYSLYGSENCDSNYVLLYDDNIYVCEDFKAANEAIAKDLETDYKNLVGGTVENRHYNNDYNMEIKKGDCKLTIHSKYIDLFKSLVDCLEKAVSDKYDARPKFGKGSVVYISNEKCTVKEVNLVKAKDFRDETEEYKYEYEYVLLTESGRTRKISEEKLASLMEDV